MLQSINHAENLSINILVNHDQIRISGDQINEDGVLWDKLETTDNAEGLQHNQEEYVRHMADDEIQTVNDEHSQNLLQETDN